MRVRVPPRVLHVVLASAASCSPVRLGRRPPAKTCKDPLLAAALKSSHAGGPGGIARREPKAPDQNDQCISQDIGKALSLARPHFPALLRQRVHPTTTTLAATKFTSNDRLPSTLHSRGHLHRLFTTSISLISTERFEPAPAGTGHLHRLFTTPISFISTEGFEPAPPRA